MKYLRRLQGAGFAVLLWLLAWFASGRLALPQADHSDEPEWTAISLSTTRQLAGRAPAGIQRDRRNGQLDKDPWRQGVQATTFGWPNPVFQKLVWGLACAPLAPRKLKINVFQRYHKGDLTKANAAVLPLLPAIDRAREVVAIESALCAVLLCLIACRMAGRVAGLSAYWLWIYHPLVRSWSHQARPDFAMLALLLGCLWLALAMAQGLAGKHGRWRLITASWLLGCVAGLCLGTKLNGGLAAIFVVLVIPLAGFFSPKDLRPSRRLRLAAVGAAGLAISGLLLALFPYLWSAPRAHLQEVLAFWSKHMAMQQDHFASFGGLATRTLGERIQLVTQRMGGADDPLRAVSGLRGGLWWTGLGVLGLVLSTAWGRLRLMRRPAAPLQVAIGLLWIAVVGVGSSCWLPLNWDRYFFPLSACAVLLQACLIGVLARVLATFQDPNAPQ